jgi:hypothetical protein
MLINFVLLVCGEIQLDYYSLSHLEDPSVIVINFVLLVCGEIELDYNSLSHLEAPHVEESETSHHEMCLRDVIFPIDLAKMSHQGHNI